MANYRSDDRAGLPTAFGGHPGLDIPDPGEYTGPTWLYEHAPDCAAFDLATALFPEQAYSDEGDDIP